MEVVIVVFIYNAGSADDVQGFLNLIDLFIVIKVIIMHVPVLGVLAPFNPALLTVHLQPLGMRDAITSFSPLFRYLYFEYNEIREIDPGTFDSMPSLQLLFLNANLLRSLPLGVFSGVNLSRLNLRNNHLLQLPMVGVLEHLTGLVQVGANLHTA